MRKLALGVDIGGTNTRLGAVDAKGRVIRRVSFPTRPSVSPRELATMLSEACGGLGGRRAFHCAGIGVPSPLDRRRRIMRHAVNMPKFRDVPFASIAERALGLPVAMENDANAAAFGEYVCGAGRHRGSMALFTLGTGIGGGLVVDGRLITGDSGFAAELGHTKVDLAGRRCGCGTLGCLEAYAGVRSMVSMARHSGVEVESGEEIFSRARKGNRACRRIVSLMTAALGAATASIAAALNPAVIVLSGGVSRAGASLLRAVRREAKKRMFPGLFQETSIELGRLGPDAGLIGAALWASQAVRAT